MSVMAVGAYHLRDSLVEAWTDLLYYAPLNIVRVTRKSLPTEPESERMTATVDRGKPRAGETQMCLAGAGKAFERQAAGCSTGRPAALLLGPASGCSTELKRKGGME